MNTIKVNQNELIEILNNLEENTELLVNYYSKVKLPNKKRTGEVNPFKDNTIIKITTSTFKFNLNYTNEIKKLNESNQDFVSSGLKGFVWINNNKILESIKTKDKHIRVYVIVGLYPTIEYKKDGVCMTDEEISVLKNFQNKQSNTDNNICMYNININNIYSICIGDIIYIIEK